MFLTKNVVFINTMYYYFIDTLIFRAQLSKKHFDIANELSENMKNYRIRYTFYFSERGR